ncbi:MAG: low temperature requirement protein A [Myxococcota bacterium]
MSPDAGHDGARGWRVRMRPREPHEPHRAATDLELLFDLSFVVAVAFAGARLHHALGAGEVGHGLLGYVPVFFAIWWAWMNFTWFASAYDTDDVPYRLLALLQIVGVLVLAAGVPSGFEQHDYRTLTLGYAIMRVALVLQWLRAAGASPEGRRTAQRYALGVGALMLAWGALLLLPRETQLWGWAVLGSFELGVPMWAERAHPTPWHAHHIAERYGLFTLIVLGESLLAATVALQEGLEGGHAGPDIVGVIVGGLLTVFGMWWLYFQRPAHRWLVTSRAAFIWGYGHLVVFGSAAAVGAGLAVAVDELVGHAAIGASAAACAVAIPVALFLASVWLLHVRPHRPGRLVHVAFVACCLAVLAAPTVSPSAGWAVLAIGLVVAGLVAVTVVADHRRAGVGRRQRTTSARGAAVVGAALARLSHSVGSSAAGPMSTNTLHHGGVMKPLTHTLAALAALAPLGAAATAHAQETLYGPSYRVGPTFGINLGGGNLSCSADECETLDGAGSLDLHVGGMLNPRLALLFDAWWMVHDEDSVTVSQGIMTGALRVWPLEQFWLQFGLGVARTGYVYDSAFVTVEDFSEWVPAFDVGIGVEPIASEDVAFDVALKYGTGFYSDGDHRIHSAALTLGVSFY